MIKFKTIEAWRKFVTDNWVKLRQQVIAMGLDTPYDQLVGIALLPVLPQNKEDLEHVLKLLRAMRYGKPIADRLARIFTTFEPKIDLKALLQKDLKPIKLTEAELQGLDWLVVMTGAFMGVNKLPKERVEFAQKTLSYMRAHVPLDASGINVQAELIRVGGHFLIANGDISVVSTYYDGDKSALTAYLNSLRSEWGMADLGTKQVSQLDNTPLHQIYTHVDVWSGDNYSRASEEALTELRFRAIDQDLQESRQSAIEALAVHPRIVITGGPGTGKSSLCRFIATCLAYACDPEAEREDKVKGLDQLGSAWIHGAILPLYVNLRTFANHTETFPKSKETAKAQHLLNYLQTTVSSKFAESLERYLLQDNITMHGAILFLDGLDEVSSVENRLILQAIIENWAVRFKKCRIVVTSRTYAYRKGDKWRLSDRFHAAELAPYSWQQIKRYIENWYTQAANKRPAVFGGHQEAGKSVPILVKDLYNTLRETQDLWALARQPMLLTLITQIHEDGKRLPEKRAELYKDAVAHLERKKPEDIRPDDTRTSLWGNIKHARLQDALMLAAYDSHRKQDDYQTVPAVIPRAELISKLMDQQKIDGGLGVSIETVIEYLGTRNGILVCDRQDYYRFPHLTFQEYLAACALMSLYDECQMPEHLTPPTKEGWVYPDNIAALMHHSPHRWRNVARFVGSITIQEKVPDSRWTLIEALLPATIKAPVDENIMHSIVVAAEIWAEAYIKARRETQELTAVRLIQCLRLIEHDERLDIPERNLVKDILNRLDPPEINAESLGEKGKQPTA